MAYTLKFVHIEDTTGGRRAFYKMALVIKPGGRSRLLKQWGRKGTAGQVKVEDGLHLTMRHEYDATYSGKTSKNYVYVDGKDMKEVEDPNDIHDFLMAQGFTAPAFDADELSDVAVSVPDELEDEFAEGTMLDAEPQPEVKRPEGWGDW